MNFKILLVAILVFALAMGKTIEPEHDYVYNTVYRPVSTVYRRPTTIIRRPAILRRSVVRYPAVSYIRHNAEDESESQAHDAAEDQSEE